MNFNLSAPIQRNSFHNILHMRKFTKLRNMKFHFTSIVTMLRKKRIDTPHA